MFYRSQQTKWRVCSFFLSVSFLIQLKPRLGNLAFFFVKLRHNKNNKCNPLCKKILFLRGANILVVDDQCKPFSV